MASAGASWCARPKTGDGVRTPSNRSSGHLVTLVRPTAFAVDFVARVGTFPRKLSLADVADVDMAVRVVDDADVADHAIAGLKALETVGTLVATTCGQKSSERE